MSRRRRSTSPSRRRSCACCSICATSAACRSSSSRTISASWPRPASASPSCMPGAFANTARSATCSASPSSLYGGPHRLPAGRGLDGGRLANIPGQPPSPFSWPPGCRFHPRCERRVELCRHSIRSSALERGHAAACHVAAAALRGTEVVHDRPAAILEVRDLHVSFASSDFSLAGCGAQPCQGRKRRVLPARCGRNPGPCRRIGLRQDHAGARDPGPRRRRRARYSSRERLMTAQTLQSSGARPR